MVIRKLFSIDNMHIVRNCSSERCKKSIHGHTYSIEVFLNSSTLDEGQMVLDFGLTKGTIKEMIKSFDKSYTLWDKESDEFKNEIKNNTDRWVEVPMSPSAESYAVCLLYLINKIVSNTNFANGEGNVTVSGVRVHETLTGYAEANLEDLKTMGSALSLSQFKFSEAIIKNWSDNTMVYKLSKFIPFNNEIPELQIAKKEIKSTSLLNDDALMYYSNLDVNHLLLLELGQLITTTNYKWWKHSEMDRTKVSAILYTMSNMVLLQLQKIDLHELAKLHAVINNIDPETIGLLTDDVLLSTEIIGLSKEIGSMAYTNDYWDMYRNIQIMLHMLGNNVVAEFNDIQGDIESTTNIFKSMITMQNDLNCIINPEWVSAKQDWQSAMLAENLEAIESIDLKDSNRSDIDNIIIELIDLIHFNISMLLELNDTDIDMLANHLSSMLRSINKEGLASSMDSDQDILNDLNLIGSYILKGEYIATLCEIYKCLGRLNVTFDDAYQIYLSKNALNIVRQKYGYKAGTYVKQWNTPVLIDTPYANISFNITPNSVYEDNVIVRELTQNIFKPTFDNDLDALVELISDYYESYIKE